jgi:hypothetical protein
VRSVAVSHDHQWVVSGSDDGSVRFWDLRTGEEQLILRGHVDGGTLQCICMHAYMLTYLTFLNVCVHAHTSSSFCCLEPDRGHAGYNGLGRAGEVMCVVVNHSHRKPMLTLTGPFAGSYTTLQ